MTRRPIEVVQANGGDQLMVITPWSLSISTMMVIEVREEDDELDDLEGARLDGMSQPSQLGQIEEYQEGTVDELGETLTSSHQNPGEYLPSVIPSGR